LESVRVLITAEEAYPEMERAFLTARRRILACYRVFDPLTRLRSREGREVGHDWFDLILHILRKGVEIDLVISDFDPILAPALHCETWRAKRALIAAAELAGPDARLRVTAAPHAARVGLLPRLVFWIPVLRRLGRRVEELNRLPAPTRARALDCSPGLWRHLRTGPDGSLAVRWVPPPDLIPGTHHQKIAVFDDELLSIGGLDLDERRYDDKGHHRRRDETWHDVQVMCRGPVVEDARRHLESFLDVVAGKRPPPAAGRLLTTLSRRRRWPVVRDVAPAPCAPRSPMRTTASSCAPGGFSTSRRSSSAAALRPDAGRCRARQSAARHDPDPARRARGRGLLRLDLRRCAAGRIPPGPGARPSCAKRSEIGWHS
jgi:hypothetical protein